MEKIKLIIKCTEERKLKMNTSSMKNIVILKDLPSNLIEEAIVFLKENEKLKKPELIDIDLKQKKTISSEKESKQKNPKDYIIKEAQMLISDYISRIENKDKKQDISYKKLKKKYQLLQKISWRFSY